MEWRDHRTKLNEAPKGVPHLSSQPALPTESNNSGPSRSKGPHDRLEPELLLSGM